jgi:hypothetical protein
VFGSGNFYRWKGLKPGGAVLRRDGTGESRLIACFFCFWRVVLNGFERWIEWLSIWNRLAKAGSLIADGLRSVWMRLNWVWNGGFESKSSRV